MFSVQSLAAYNFWIGEGLDRFGTGDATGGRWAEITAFVLETAGKHDVDPARFWYGTLEPHEVAEPLRERDLAPRSRKSIQEFVFGAEWGTPATTTR